MDCNRKSGVAIVTTIKEKEDIAYIVNSNDLIPLVNYQGTVGKSVTATQLVKASDIYIVTDTTIEDHSDPQIPGSIVSTISKLSSSGGTIHIGPGTFELINNAIVIPSNIRIIGSGKNTTIINQNHPTENGINVDSGVNFVGSYFSIENLKITMPVSGNAGDAINLVQSRSSFGIIRSIIITGGTASSWGITNNGNNQTNFEDIYINGFCNGARWLNDSGNINYGDCYVYGLEITLNTFLELGFYYLVRKVLLQTIFHLIGSKLRQKNVSLHLAYYLTAT